MATKVKPCRLNVTGTPQVGDVPVYYDEDTFEWGAGGGGGTGDVTGPNSSTDGDVALFDGNTGKIIKDSGVNLSSKLDASALSDTNYGGAWNGDTTHTPTKNAIYTKLHTMDVEIGNKAADNTVVKLSGNQTINGTKTFTTSPVVPSKTTDATNTGTAIATEAQVYKKSEIVYATQAEYTALLPGAASDGKHYFIYTPSIINVTGVTLDESSITLTTVGQTEQLTATVSPNDATDKSVNWSSSDQNIATVDNTGLVTCVTPGTCTITVTTTDGGFTATCGVTNTWTPGANTLLYLPLNSTYSATDQSGRSISTTNNNVTFGTYTSANVDCAYFSGSNTSIPVSLPSMPNSFTLIVWCYNTGYAGDGKIYDSRGGGVTFLTRINGYEANKPYAYSIDNGSSADVSLGTNNQNKWVMMAVTSTNGSQIGYLLGDNLNVTGTSTNSYTGYTPSYTNIGNEYNNGANRRFAGYMSNIILEDKVWSSAEIESYYNSTKGDYGIS